MSKEKDTLFRGTIGDGSGLINPNSRDFRVLREEILKHSSVLSDEEKVIIRIQGVKYRMDSYLNDRSEDRLIPVGAFLKELVEIIRVPHKDFAAYIGIKNTNLSALYRGKRKINHDLAMKLGHIFNMDPALWLHIQKQSRIAGNFRSKAKKKYQKYQLNDLLNQAG